MHRSRAFPVALLALVAAVPATAERLVEFADGRTMVVESAAPEGPDAVLLTLVGGGELLIPAERVVDWSELERRPEVPEQPAEPVLLDGPWRAAAGPYAELIARVARENRLDPALLTSMALVESALDPQAVSPKGAQGLLQLMPQTAARFGVSDSFDAHQNVEGGARYLGWLLERYEGRTELALAGYNAGEAAVDRYDGVPPYRETRNYVAKVMDRAQALSASAGHRAGP